MDTGMQAQRGPMAARVGARAHPESVELVAAPAPEAQLAPMVGGLRRIARVGRAASRLGVLVAVVVTAAGCGGQPQEARAGPTPIVRIGGAGGVGPPGEAKPLPPGGGTLAPGDYGIEIREQGATRATLALVSISCATGSVLRIGTEEGVILAEIPETPEGSCGRALDQWRRVAADATRVGVRYAVEGGSRSLTLIADTGGSLTVVVVDARRGG